MTEKRTVEEINKLKKAELVEGLEVYGLPTTGTVKELRERLIAHLHGTVTRSQPEEDDEECETSDEEPSNRANQPMSDDQTSDKEESQPAKAKLPKDVKTCIKPKKEPASITTAEMMDRIRKWGIYYDGGTDVYGFLERVEELTNAYDIPTDFLLRGLPQLLRGKAQLWYRNNKTNWETWNEFTNQLKDYFLPPRYQHKLEEEFRARHMGQNEGIREYITSMQTLGRRVGVTERDIQLERIYANLKPEYRLYIRRQDFKNITELQKLGEEYEAIRQEQNHHRSVPIAKELATRTRPVLTSHIISPEYNQRTCCWKCGGHGHTRLECQNRPKMFCSRCGKTGVLSRQCQCQGNGERTERNQVGPVGPRRNGPQ